MFKKKRRKGYRVKNGHRQALTELVIEKIQTSGSKSKAAPAKAEAPKPKAEKKPAAKKLAKPTAKKTESTDHSKLTVAQLKEEAKKKGIEGISAMKKADLIKALSK